MQDVQQLLKDLVAFKIYGGQSNLAIIDYIENVLKSYGVSYKLVENKAEKKASLHCRIGPAVDGGLILSGHTDVVPVEGQDWHTDPFVLTDGGDGKLYARGSCDMKGFIACCLAALPEFTNANLKKPIYFAFSYDEEIGCLAGPELVEDIKATYTEKPKYAIIGEPSMLEPVVGQKGIVFYRTIVKGSAGHSSRIKDEVSSIHEACRLVMWLERKMLSLLEAGHEDDRFVPNHTSIHVGRINGGIAPNVIADHCQFDWDVRNIPMDRIEHIFEEYVAYCKELELELRKKFPGTKILHEELHPVVPALDTPEEKSVVSLIQHLSGKEELTTVAYAAEAGQFSEGGFESVICGPGDIAQAHRANEFVSIEQLNGGVDMIHRLIQEVEKEDSLWF